MAHYTPSQMFAQLKNEELDSPPQVTLNPTGQRLLVLREAGFACSPPDRIKCVISCCNSKKTAEEAKSSVSRRIDYIKQTLRNHTVKEKQYNVHSLLSHTDDGQYVMSGEVSVTFHEVATYERTVNLLVEKLEGSVRVSDAVFFVSPEKVSDLRRQACLNAVRNCRTKALSIAQYLNQTLGPALTVREEKTLEYTGNSPSQEPNAHHDAGNSRTTSVLNSGQTANVCNAIRTSIQQRIADGTVTVHVQIYAEFECKERTRKSNGCK